MNIENVVEWKRELSQMLKINGVPSGLYVVTPAEYRVPVSSARDASIWHSRRILD
jgi:hypothetical protein